MSEETTTTTEAPPTSVFVCSPVPTDPGCVDYGEYTTATVPPTTTTTVVEVPSEPAAPVGVDELAYTGAFELMLVFVAIALILVGAVLDTVSRAGDDDE